MSAAAAAEIQGRAERLARWTSAYRPHRDVPDELMDHEGRPKGAWPRFLDQLGGMDEVEIGARFISAVRRIRDTGISYRIYGDKREHAWPLGSLPLVLEQADWETLSAGIVERAALMETILADLYGPERLVAEGLLPAAVVAGSPEFMRPLVGVTPPGGRILKLYAADVTRGPDGRWRVLADRTQSPSGPGYALENRLVLTRAFPDLHADLQVERLAAFFQAFRDGLAVGAQRSDPRICLLTSGVFSSTYVEQAALARYLGLLLVEGDDLVMQDGALHIRTVSGLKRADVLWRRIDSDYLDPLELNPASRLGVPGIVEALRNGNLVVGNMPGSGILESGALAAYLPGIARHLLGRDLTLAGPKTWWCGDPRAARQLEPASGGDASEGSRARRDPGPACPRCRTRPPARGPARPALRLRRPGDDAARHHAGLGPERRLPAPGAAALRAAGLRGGDARGLARDAGRLLPHLGAARCRAS
jgi:uncharacterized circularly permuted ATP-grasp superfamily protein